MTKQAVFKSIEAALSYAGQTGSRVSVDVKQAADQLTGGLGPLSRAEVWAVKQMRERRKYEAAIRGGAFEGQRFASKAAVKII